MAPERRKSALLGPRISALQAQGKHAVPKSATPRALAHRVQFPTGGTLLIHNFVHNLARYRINHTTRLFTTMYLMYRIAGTSTATILWH